MSYMIIITSIIAQLSSDSLKLTTIMNCSRCNNHIWCICQEMLQLHKTTISKHNQCLCCVERARVIETSKIKTSSRTKQKMKQLSANLYTAYRMLFGNDVVN